MKKIFYLFVIALLSTNTFAQDIEKPTTRKKFDLAFDAFQLAERGRIALDFDYNLKKNTALTFNVSHGSRLNGLYDYRYNDKYASIFEKVKVGVGYKMYFSKKEHEGLYSTLGLNYSYGYYWAPENDFSYNYNDFNSFKLNFKLGYKYVTPNNYFIDIFTEVAHPLWGEDYYKFTKPDMCLDYGIKIGKRF